MNIEIISGSPRKSSLTYRIAQVLQKELPKKTAHSVGLIDVRDYDLGLLQNVFPSVADAPPAFQGLAERMFKADAFILVSPEYNGSYSAALKNLLDHFPKQSKKAFGLATGSPGILGGMRCAQQLLLLVPALFGIASSTLLLTPEVDKKIDAAGNILDPNYQKNVDGFIQDFLWLAEQINKK